MKKEPILSPIDLLITIVDQNSGEKVINFLKQKDVSYYVECSGHGTAESELQDLFGFGIRERDIVISLVNSKKSEELLHELNEIFGFNERHTGLAFTVPLNSAEKQLADLLNIKLGE